ncbi:DUF2807 domain-containing protein [Patiriisocius marinistellae]|uniref:DUF2807 domain-containing protein n=1 Tax=Patiriisocius marinistellae TaxID=2494560 RepID=A0A5J4G1J6_9FLAO|nr:head GIN domain-containing protein [Patiriisocius marinistellae]GEQ86539.1 DUF2807 domain-containing protein [Patiriisocius marinistellae]
MKNLKTILAITVCIVATQITFAQKNIKGSGNVITKTITTSDYHAVNTIGSITVELVSGNEGNIKVIAEDNLQEFVEITNNGGALKVTTKNNLPYYKSTHGIRVIVPFKELDKVTLIGSGDVIGKDIIKTNNFETKLTGSGDLKLEVKAQEINAYIKGSGDLTLRGTTNVFNAVVSGSGDLIAKNLKTTMTDISLTGSGDASVYASSSIKARVNGSGDIEYFGNPTTKDTKVFGSGDIDKM